MFKIVIDEKKCIGCANCVVACPYSASVSPRSGHGFGEGENKIRIVNGIAEFKGRCSGCGICLIVCPMNAIEIKPDQNLE